MANLMAEWLILAGAEISEVQQRVENHLHDMILKTFDPKKADAIFAEEGETPSWQVVLGPATPCASPPPRPTFFPIILFLARRPVNRDGRKRFSYLQKTNYSATLAGH
jgi:hypothetical protein